MRENNQHNPQGPSSERRYSCEVYHLFGGTPCAKAAKENVDGLVFCERHALEAKLEGQISCWEEMLFHIDLWSREASRRKRQDVVGLLDVERAKATSAMQRACEDLDLLRSESSRGEVPPGSGKLFRIGSLPPRGARLLSLGLRRR